MEHGDEDDKGGEDEEVGNDDNEGAEDSEGFDEEDKDEEAGEDEKDENTKSDTPAGSARTARASGAGWGASALPFLYNAEVLRSTTPGRGRRRHGTEPAPVWKPGQARRHSGAKPEHSALLVAQAANHTCLVISHSLSLFLSLTCSIALSGSCSMPERARRLLRRSSNAPTSTTMT